MSYKNYILIQKHLFRSEYIFADTEEKYLLISCKIWNKDQGKFFRAMEKLRNKMPLVGKTDYEEFCKETFKMFD